MNSHKKGKAEVPSDEIHERGYRREASSTIGDYVSVYATISCVDVSYLHIASICRTE